MSEGWNTSVVWEFYTNNMEYYQLYALNEDDWEYWDYDPYSDPGDYYDYYSDPRDYGDYYW